MPRFYWPIVKRAFTVFFEVADKGQTAIGVALYLLTFVVWFNEPIGKRLVRTWEGFPYWYGAIPLAALFLYGFLLAVYEEHTESEARKGDRDRRLRALEEQLTPRLDVVFSNTDETCRMEYLRDGLPYVLYRVGIVNLSAQSIEGVRVTLRHFSPQNAPFLPAEMVLMHRSAEESIQGVTINKGSGPGVYADIVGRRVDEFPDTQIEIQYAYDHLPFLIPPARYVFVLRAEGEGVVQECERRFVVDVVEGNLVFYPEAG